MSHSQFRGHRPADLTHVLRRDPGRPTPSSYRRLLREPVDPGLLDLVPEWLARHLTPDGDAATAAEAEAHRPSAEEQPTAS